MISNTQAYLETDARIIAENDRFVVVAVRLEKSIVARNLPFLSALADVDPKPALKTDAERPI